MKIVVISDTHKQESYLTLPEGDMLIHCGDMSCNSLLDVQIMNDWFGKQDFKYKLCVAGNHDTFLERIGKDWCKELFTHVRYLENDYIEIEGLKMFFSPHTPEFNSWAFMYPRGSLDAKRIWEKIPYGLDFLVTHGPPYQTLDTGLDGKSCGCEVLQREIYKKKPKRHLFGHLHSSYGIEKINNTIHYNVSLLDDNYNLVNKPTIIEV